MARTQPYYFQALRNGTTIKVEFSVIPTNPNYLAGYHGAPDLSWPSVDFDMVSPYSWGRLHAHQDAAGARP